MSSLRVEFEKIRIEKFLIEDRFCASVHEFSIHFSPLRYEKHSFRFVTGKIIYLLTREKCLSKLTNTPSKTHSSIKT